MSRLFGRTDDVYSISKLLVETDFKEYKPDKRRIDHEALVNAPGEVEMYLPDKAIDFINTTDVGLYKSLFTREVKYRVAACNEGELPAMLFPVGRLIEEYKDDVIFFLGRLLANYSPDELPKHFDISCEFSDMISIILVYLHLREQGKEDMLLTKFSKDFVQNARRFIKVYEDYQRYCENVRAKEFFSTEEGPDKYAESNKRAILIKTLNSLVPLSSMDASLQIIDRNPSQEEYKELIEELMLNPEHNREKLINDKGIETFGFHRLRKEINRVKR